MDIGLRLFFMGTSLLVVFSVIHMLIRRRLNESNSILWLFVAVVTLVFGFFPDLLSQIAHWVGIEYAPALLFFVSTVIVMMIVFRSSLNLSQLDAKVSELAMTVSILKEENKRLAEKLKEQSKDCCEER